MMLLQNKVPVRRHPTRDRCDLVRSLAENLRGIGVVHIINGRTKTQGGEEVEEAGVGEPVTVATIKEVSV